MPPGQAPTRTRPASSAGGNPSAWPISQAASGFVYYVSLKGVTGANRLDADAVASKLAEIRQYTELPVGVGFGIRDAESAAQVAAVADAVVVGSILVSQIAELSSQPDSIAPVLAATVAELRAGIDAAPLPGA